MPNIGPLEIGIVLLIVLIIFGPKRLPGLGKSLGTGLKDFKESISGNDKDDDEKDDGPSQLTQAAAASPPVAETPVQAPASTDEPTRTSTGS